jgi:hypothetical protein
VLQPAGGCQTLIRRHTLCLEHGSLRRLHELSRSKGIRQSRELLRSLGILQGSHGHFIFFGQGTLDKLTTPIPQSECWAHRVVAMGFSCEAATQKLFGKTRVLLFAPSSRASQLLTLDAWGDAGLFNLTLTGVKSECTICDYLPSQRYHTRHASIW